MAALTLRQTKGTQLTNAEIDANFTALNNELAVKGPGSVTSVGLSVPTGLTVSGSPITSSGTLAISLTAGYSIPTTASQTNWDAAYTDRNKWDGGSTGLVAATARTSLGLVIGTNVQAWDADLDAIAALAGTSGFLKKTAANTWALDTSTYLTGITSGQVTTALGFTPYNATNPSGYITSSALSAYLPLAGGTLTGPLVVTSTGGAATDGLIVNSNGASGVHITPASLDTTQSGRLFFTTSTAGQGFSVRNSAGSLFIQSGATYGSSSGSTVALTLSQAGALNTAGAITQNGSQVLHAGNYTSYSPSLTGSGASGTWGISVTGNAATVTNGLVSTGSYADPAWLTSVNYSKLTGTVPTWNQSTTGNAATATALQTARTIGGVSFNGTANINLPGVNAAGNQNTTGTAAGLTDNSSWMLNRGSVAAASIDTATLNGFYTQTNASDSQGLLVFNAGGSLGPLQMTFTYGGLMQFRGKTDSTTWTPWKTVVTSANVSTYALPISGGTLTGAYLDFSNTSPSLRITSGPGTFYIGDDDIVNLGSGAVVATPSSRISSGVAILSTHAYATGQGDNKTHFGYYNGSGYVNYVRGDATYFDSATLQIGGNQALHAGNYTSYSPSLTGSGASGTWGINVTGNAGSASTQAKSSATTVPASTAYAKWLFATNSTSGTTDWNDVSNTRPGTGEVLLLGSHTNGPGGGNYYHPFNIEYGGIDGVGNVTQMAVAYGNAANDLFMRGRFGGAWTSWIRFLNSSNYTSYPIASSQLTGTIDNARLNGGTYTINVTGSSGSTTGNAATATILQTARTINGVSFNGSANITVADSTKLPLAGGTMTGAISFAVGQTWPTFNQSTTGSAATLTTARTFTIGNTGKTFNGSANVGWTLAEIGALPLSGGSLTGTLGTTAGVNLTRDGATADPYAPLSVTRGTASNFAYASFTRAGQVAWVFGINTSNTLVIGGGTSGIDGTVTSNRLALDTASNLTAGGNVTAYSDERLKKDWAPLASDYVSRLALIKSGTYTRIDSGERQAGSSAQDWQELLPEVVMAGSDDAKTLSLAYGNAALVSAVELAKDNRELRARVERLEALVEKLLEK